MEKASEKRKSHETRIRCEREKGAGYFLLIASYNKAWQKPSVPRIPRGQQGGYAYHVINRGNGRTTVFHKPQDYFGLRLFQTFQTFNRCAPFKTLKSAKTRCLTSQKRSVNSRFADADPFSCCSGAGAPNRIEPIHAVAIDESRAPLSSALRR